jgi:hypothetical protein
MRPPTTTTLLRAWELGRNRQALDRALLLYAIAAPEADADTLADRPLGQRNTALVRLSQLMFGDSCGACVDCPACGERLEFALEPSALIARSGTGSSHVEVDGLRFRLPTTRDLARIAQDADADTATERLLLSLVEPRPAGGDEGLRSIAARVATAIEAADPCVDFALDLTCPACREEWTTSFDIAAYVWEEIDATARRLLDEVHVLARAYGWSEGEILDLSDARRAAYLDRVLA